MSDEFEVCFTGRTGWNAARKFRFEIHARVGGNAKIGISVQILCDLCENLHVPAFKTAFDVRDGGRVGEVRPSAALDGEDAVPDGRLKSGIFFVVDVNFPEERGVGR